MTRTDPNSPQTFEKAPDGPQGRPEGGSAALASLEASNGPQVGADGLDTHNVGPSIREAAEADRRWWTDKYAGEQP